MSASAAATPGSSATSTGPSPPAPAPPSSAPTAVASPPSPASSPATTGPPSASPPSSAQFGDASLVELRKSIRLVQPAGPYDIDAELTAHQAVLTGFFGPLGLSHPPTEDMLAESDRLLRQVGLPHVRDHLYSTLSSGEKVRSLIARALAREPRLLLL